MEKGMRNRFGIIAVRKGFISKEQFVEAMGMQIETELEGEKALLFGEVLIEMGLMSREQVSEVLEDMVRRK